MSGYNRFIRFLLNEEVKSFNELNKIAKEHPDEYQGVKNRSGENPMGLIDHPDLDPRKDQRFRYGVFMIQPTDKALSPNGNYRKEAYSNLKQFLRMLYKAVTLIQQKKLGKVFEKNFNDPSSLSVIRLINDPKNEFAELYQQEDDNSDGLWERGDFIYNLGAKNDNIHTIVHAIGHQYFYECLDDELAEQWKEFYDARKYKGRKEFVTQYAMTNHREDFAETFAVFVLGADIINSLYDKRQIHKDPQVVHKILQKFKQVVQKQLKLDEKKKEDKK